MSDEYQLEFWVPKGRKGGAWVPASPADAGAPNGRFRTWRKVKKGHKHRDKLSHSIAPVRGAYAVDRKAQCESYCQWARLKGLTHVTVYAGDWRSRRAALQYGFAFTEVDPEDFIGPAPSPELDLAEAA